MVQSLPLEFALPFTTVEAVKTLSRAIISASPELVRWILSYSGVLEYYCSHSILMTQLFLWSGSSGSIEVLDVVLGFYQELVAEREKWDKTPSMDIEARCHPLPLFCQAPPHVPFPPHPLLSSCSLANTSLSFS